MSVNQKPLPFSQNYESLWVRRWVTWAKRIYCQSFNGDISLCVEATQQQAGIMRYGLALLLTTIVAGLADELVVLKHGSLKGHRLTSRKGREIFAFQGIPYAKPPVGELRFKVCSEVWSVLSRYIESTECQHCIWWNNEPTRNKQPCKCTYSEADRFEGGWDGKERGGVSVRVVFGWERQGERDLDVGRNITLRMVL
jgi:hypothetical protein